MQHEDIMRIEIERIVERVKMRLEQYELHAQMLQKNRRDAEGARALVARLRDGAKALEEYRDLMFSPNEHKSRANRADAILKVFGLHDSPKLRSRRRAQAV
jgi:hypothetical protein